MTEDPDSNEDVAVAKTIANHTYQQLRRDIVSGVLAPGTKLRMDMLIKRYGVGMSPLREALVKLTGDALVHAEGQRGFWVSPISIEELDDTMAIRTLIETEAVVRSIENGGPEWEERVRQAYETLSSLEERLSENDEGVLAQWERANAQFHEALVSACGSAWLVRLRRTLHQHSERYRAISLANRPAGRDVHDEHEAIAEAALSRKSLRASRLIEVHLQRTADAVREAMRARAEETAPPKGKRRQPGR